jgi:glyoxylase I family protein
MNLDIRLIHHVSLTVRQLEPSRRFYREVLGLAEIARPPFPFAGAWFQAGAAQQLHLIVNPEGTFRAAAGIDTKDVHFAVRVSSYAAALASLRAQGFREDLPAGDPRQIVVNPRATAGFPQIYILDPDRHVIEINAETLDP